MAVLSAELESKLETEKRQSETLMYNFDRTITDLQPVNEDINVSSFTCCKSVIVRSKLYMRVSISH
jgi:hypothetical protein